MDTSSETFRAAIENFRTKETETLLKIFKENNLQNEELEALQQVLERRQEVFPNSQETIVPQRNKKKQQILGVNGNCILFGTEQPERIEMHFPKEGFLTSEKSTFKDQKDLVSYLSEVFSIPIGANDSIKVSIKRKGKYQRLNRFGKPVFTFGDPIIDTITNEHGWTTIGKETFDFKMIEIAAASSRGGGISTIDLSYDNNSIKDLQIKDATSVNGNSSLLEKDENHTIIASSNQSQIDFHDGNSLMRFRAFKKNSFFYKKIGTEIETWRGNFSSAYIESIYASPVVPNDPFICAIEKRDTDSDSNDHYVDEYESSVFFDLPSTVRSYCEARWKGQDYDGTVSKGDCIIFVNE